MNIVPFTIEPLSKDYVLSKVYGDENSFKLTIPKNTSIEKPIYLKIKPTAEDLTFQLSVECEEGATGVVIEDWTSEVTSESVNFKLQIVCNPNSSLKYIVLNSASAKTQVVEDRKTEIHADAKCDIYSYYFGTKKVESKLVQETVGKAAEVNTDIITRSTEEQDLNFDCEHQFNAANGTGQINMKAVAQEKGMVKLDGMVNITARGGGSAGYLQQETLNLSPQTIVKATPGLKIDTNDVKAGHGSSIRNLNQEDLFYFAARGIGEEEAKKLLVTGFLGAELEKINEWEGVYEEVRKLI